PWPEPRTVSAAFQGFLSTPSHVSSLSSNHPARGSARLLLTPLPIPVGIRWLPAVCTDEDNNVLPEPTGQGADGLPQRVVRRPLLKLADSPNVRAGLPRELFRSQFRLVAELF